VGKSISVVKSDAAGYDTGLQLESIGKEVCRGL